MPWRTIELRYPRRLHVGSIGETSMRRTPARAAFARRRVRVSGWAVVLDIGELLVWRVITLASVRAAIPRGRRWAAGARYWQEAWRSFPHITGMAPSRVATPMYISGRIFHRGSDPRACSFCYLNLKGIAMADGLPRATPIHAGGGGLPDGGCGRRGGPPRRCGCPLTREGGVTSVAQRDLEDYRARDRAARCDGVREITRLSIAAGLDDLDYAPLSDDRP